MRRGVAAAALALAGLGLAPAAASAHSLVRARGDAITYVAADATSINTVTARAERGRLLLRDTTVDGGIDPGPCRPLGVAPGTGWVIEVSCPARGTAAVRVDLGEREDSAVVRLPVPVVLRGGPGADALAAGARADTLLGGDGRDRLAGAGGDDRLDGGSGDDALAGEDGADTLDAGLGRDLLDGGAGDDLLRGRDGQADDLRCGAGADRVEADTLDAVAADCEHVERAPIAPPPEPGAAGADERSPRVRAGAAATQPLGRVRILATSSERGVLSASGFLDVGGLSLPVQGDRRPVSVGGGGVVLRVRLAARERRRVLRALRRGRRATVRMGVVGTDRAGNSRLVLATPIRLRLPRARASHPSPATPTATASAIPATTARSSATPTRPTSTATGPVTPATAIPTRTGWRRAAAPTTAASSPTPIRPTATGTGSATSATATPTATARPTRWTAARPSRTTSAPTSTPTARATPATPTMTTTASSTSATAAPAPPTRCRAMPTATASAAPATPTSRRCGAGGRPTGAGRRTARRRGSACAWRAGSRCG